MFTRSALLVSATFAICAAQPAMAEHHAPVLEAETVAIDDERAVDDLHTTSALPIGAQYAPTVAPTLAYTAAERESWLYDCAILMGERNYDYDDYYGDDGNGGLIGGLLGAVIGGFAGNRIDGGGSRWAGTLIGAGLGGVAGAVIGSAIDSDIDDDARYADDGWSDVDPYALRYCDAYLRRYEAQGPSAFATQRAHAPVSRAIPAPQSTGLQPVE